MNHTQCGEPSAICQGGTCRCNSPYYTPCGTSECSKDDNNYIIIIDLYL